MILGTMVQGEWVTDDGSTYQPVTVYFGLLRLWDSRAVWHKMEKDTTALEANIRFAESRGAQVMFVFGEPPASACWPGTKQPSTAAWDAFVRSVVAQAAGRIKYWELWNEPAIPGYWDGTPEQLVEQSRIGYQTIKELQPDAVVLSPSFTEMVEPRGRAFIQAYTQAGGLQWCDGIAFHGYAAQPEDLRGGIAALRSLVGARALWNTEYVIGPVSLEQRPRAMTDSLLLQAQLGIQCAVWNAEIPGSEDYTDPTMQRVHDLLSAPPATNKGCSPFGFLRN